MQSRFETLRGRETGDPTTFGQIPSPDALRHLKHQTRLNGEAVSKSHNPREFWGWLFALWGLSALDEAERAEKTSEQLRQQIDGLQQQYQDLQDRNIRAAQALAGTTNAPPQEPPVNNSPISPSREGHRQEDYIWRERSRRPGRERPYRD